MNIDFAKCIFGDEERNAVKRVLEGHWLASGPENEAFQEEFAEYVGSKYAICVNSGSSSNLIALASLSLPPGSKVLTSACGFPATLSPIIHFGLEPVLVDYQLDTHNVDVDRAILRLDEVKAVIFAHTLANPVDLRLINAAKSMGIPVIEDCCEALGTKVNGRHVGTFGTLGTFSFYPSHQMTAGGSGGMVVTDDKHLAMQMKSMRDWGKTWRWDEKLGDNKTCYTEDMGLDYLYYRHYVYETLGYNFKLPEICAAFGREQLKRLETFSEQREFNFHYLRAKLSELDEFVPIKFNPEARISWFGYPLTLKDGSELNRNMLGDYLESKGVRHRPFFAGNILQHKPFYHLWSELDIHPHELPFPVADKLMRDSLFIGCWAGMTQEMLDYIVEVIGEFVHLHTKLERKGLPGGMPIKYTISDTGGTVTYR